MKAETPKFNDELSSMQAGLVSMENDVIAEMNDDVATKGNLNIDDSEDIVVHNVIPSGLISPPPDNGSYFSNNDVNWNGSDMYNINAVSLCEFI